MAVPALTETFDNLYTSTWIDVRAETVNQIYNATPFWYLLTKRKRMETRDGGRFLEFNLEYAKNSTVTSFGRGDTIGLGDTEIYTRARYQWKYLAATIVRFFTDDQQNRGKAEVFSLARGKINNTRGAIIDSLETMLFSDGTGNSSKDVDGLESFVRVDPTTSTTVGEINQSTNIWWRNRQKTSTGAASIYLLSDMRNLYNTCSKLADGSMTISSRPDVIVGDQTSYELYEDELMEMKRIISKEMADGGFEDDSLVFKGKPLIWSPAAVAGRFYFLNTRRIMWIADSMVNFEMTSWKEAPNGLDRYAQIVVAGNFVCSNRQQQGVLTAIAA